ncbi:hypothetical protein [Mucilaginibacter ginsenosidivorans]|nr:hypothetical protein [Mucilaginibacter ginsenosidivorans]
MEVHHHPQLEHKPKPWKEYLLEGFSDATEGTAKKLHAGLKTDVRSL